MVDTKKFCEHCKNINEKLDVIINPDNDKDNKPQEVKEVELVDSMVVFMIDSWGEIDCQNEAQFDVFSSVFHSCNSILDTRTQLSFCAVELNNLDSKVSYELLLKKQAELSKRLPQQYAYLYNLTNGAIDAFQRVK